MVDIVLRAGKGSPLTNAEVDANFSNLKTAVEAAALSAAWASITGKPTTLSGYGITDAQAALVSGTSIKTVNGQSVLGSGNIQIDGGVTSFNTRTGALTLSSGDVTGALGFTPYNGDSNPYGFITSASLTPYAQAASLASYLTTASAANTYLAKSGGTLTGALTVGGSLSAAGDLLMTANAGGNRVVGFAGGTNTTLVLQSGAVSGPGANLELTSSAFAFLDATETRIRSLDGSVQFLALTSTATNVVTGALQQQGNQVLHAGNYSSYAQNRIVDSGGSGSYVQLSSSNELEYYNSSGVLQPLYLQHSGAADSLRGPGGNVILHAGNYSSYAASASHTHSYLPLSGGTLTGHTRVQAGGLNVGVVDMPAWAYGTSVINFETGGLLSTSSTAMSMWGNGFPDFIAGHIRTKTTGKAAWLELSNGAMNLWATTVDTNGSRYSNSVTIGMTYTVSTVGNTTLAQWQALFSGLSAVPSLNQAIIATATGTLSGTGTVWQFTNAISQRLSLNTSGVLNVFGAIQQSGNQVLHAGNYGSYALPLSGGTMTGSLALGATLAAWDTFTPVLQLPGGASLVGVTGQTVLSSNFYYGGGASKRIALGGAAQIAFGGTGDFYFQGAASGAADSAITWTTLLSLSSAGNLSTFGTLKQGANQVLHAGNYTSYSPSLSGSGASGLWNISVLGSAGYLVPRTLTVASATSLTMDCDVADIVTQANTQATGTLTINAPIGTLVNGQKIMLRLTSTNVQTFAWNGIFRGSTDQPLPTASSGGSKEDYLGFIYDSSSSKWDLIAKNFGF